MDQLIIYVDVERGSLLVFCGYMLAFLYSQNSGWWSSRLKKKTISNQRTIKQWWKNCCQRRTSWGPSLYISLHSLHLRLKVLHYPTVVAFPGEQHSNVLFMLEIFDLATFTKKQLYLYNDREIRIRVLSRQN